MTPNRLDQISRIYHEALSRSEGERDAFLNDACGGDQLLREEIESLLKHDEQARGFIETPGLVVVAQRIDQLNPGSAIGTYSILSRAGSGGMGDVYHARDMRLGREVAIKCLPPSFATDPARRVRFEREARMLATLNHPNIAQIHGLEDSAGPALVMEWVPGKTLSNVIADGALPVDRVLPIARQIADAIDGAHESGILHRDLKPSNIKLRPDGVVKVLDFGLAKAFATDPMTAAQASTVGATETLEGTVLGTPGYMSPEQARGLPVDKRTDVWAFGCVIYEMLAGCAPFAGSTSLDTLTAVLDRDPAWSKLPPSTPPRLRELLQRCLSKDPASRLRDIGDARLDLAVIAAGDAAPGPPSARIPWRTAIAALAALVAVSVAIVIVTRYRGAPVPAPRIEFLVPAPAGTTFVDLAAGLAVSPDGKSIVMTAQAPGTSAASLWLQTLDSLTPRLLPNTQGAKFPAWSPDGRSIAYFADNQLKLVDLAGGAPLSLCAASATAGLPGGASVNRDGVILISSVSGLQRVSSSEKGAVRPVTVADVARRELAHGFPQFLPDGDRFLYFIWSDDSNVQGVYASSLSAPGRRTRLLRTPSKAVFVPEHDGHPAYLLWMQERTLLAQRIDARSLQLVGDPSTVAQNVNVSIYNGRPMFSVSETGTLAYVEGQAPTKRRMVWMRRGDPAPVPAAPEAMYWNLSLAPDGERIALGRFGDATSGDAANLDVWIWDIARATEERITFSPARDAAPIWSPDGREIVHGSGREGGAGLYRRPASSDEASMQRLTGGYTLPYDWSRDGRYILYTQLGDVMALRLDGDPTSIPVAQTEFTETTPAISPDGRWVSFAANYTGRFEIYVQPFPGGAGVSPQRISSDGGYGGKWRADGGEFFFTGLNGAPMGMTIHIDPSGVRGDKARALFGPDIRIRPDNVTRQFDVTADGQRFLMILRSPDDDAPTQMTVVYNWPR